MPGGRAEGEAEALACVSSVAGLSGASLHCPVPAQDSAQADALSAEGVGG